MHTPWKFGGGDVRSIRYSHLSAAGAGRFFTASHRKGLFFFVAADSLKLVVTTRPCLLPRLATLLIHLAWSITPDGRTNASDESKTTTNPVGGRAAWVHVRGNDARICMQVCVSTCLQSSVTTMEEPGHSYIIRSMAGVELFRAIALQLVCHYCDIIHPNIKPVTHTETYNSARVHLPTHAWGVAQQYTHPSHNIADRLLQGTEPDTRLNPSVYQYVTGLCCIPGLLATGCVNRLF